MIKFCTNCGSNIDNNQEKCLVCGKVLKYNSEQIKETSANENNNFNKSNTDESSLKSRSIAIILALFLGSLGIHNFYLGYKSKGIAQLLITTIGSLACGVGAFITQLWVIIDILSLAFGRLDKDADGNQLRS